MDVKQRIKELNKISTTEFSSSPRSARASEATKEKVEGSNAELWSPKSARREEKEEKIEGSNAEVRSPKFARAREVEKIGEAKSPKFARAKEVEKEKREVFPSTPRVVPLASNTELRARTREVEKEKKEVEKKGEVVEKEQKEITKEKEWEGKDKEKKEAENKVEVEKEKKEEQKEKEGDQGKKELDEEKKKAPPPRRQLGKVASSISLLSAAGKQKSFSKLPIPQNHKPAFIDSLDPQLLAAIKEWLPDKDFHLIYYASRDGFEEEQFHLLCDNKGPTLTLIQSSSFLFGGYSPDDWESPEKDKYKTNPSAFIFTLSNPHSLPPTKYSFREGDQRAYSTKCSKRYGITFGEQVHWAGDIQISSSDHSGYANINFPVSFVDTTGKGDSTFAGSSKALTQDILVYSVK